jgi:hypothetical protein
MEFEFAGNQLDIPDEFAVKMLSDEDLANGIQSFVDDYDRAITKKLTELVDKGETIDGKDPRPALKMHKLIILSLNEAARRLRHKETNDVAELAETIFGPLFDYPFPEPREDAPNDDPESDTKPV